MRISVEISKYPLNQDYKPVILDFINRLNTYSSIEIVTNTMSTQIFGEYDDVMNALKNEIKSSFAQDLKHVMVMKIINGDLRP